MILFNKLSQLEEQELVMHKKHYYPEVGRNTVIFAGAVVVGNIRVGCNCRIGANSVVLDDVPDNSTAVGAPARVITTD
ncbi:hypothetical protein CCR91_18875 [Thiorhodovibrio winogradskyi]|nr:hypothetical protein [Thiorhodovibrio winogradskyi]